MALEDLMKLSVKQGIEDCPLSGIEHYGISMSTPTSFPVPGSTLDLSGVYGGVYISAHIVSALWGISCMQIFTYFIHYPKDKTVFKILVVVLWSMLTVQLFSIIQPEYFVLIASWGNPAALFVDQKENSVEALMTALTALVAQCFFTYRLYIFSRRLLFPIIFLPLIIGQLVVEAIDLHISFTTNNNQHLTAKTFINPTIASNAFPVAIDAGIAACMTYWLFKESKGAAGSHEMVVRLITLTINSGFWTASVALASLVASIAGSAQTYGTIYYLLCPLYCNTVLANLNAREYIRDAQRSEIVLGSNLRFEAAPRSTVAAGVSFAAPSSHYPPSSEEHITSAHMMKEEENKVTQQ
ncbi:hypothetical protein BDP27DRAFT_1404557 [Rhodocollybia butyracea]|uniref:DUF6534 domain-containing protein n=1 Tax=Rhodocollybia butyracea TaxID=206335 RepID=A0A9P5PI40_9AGAR|nr:hypothetical protein BDP27DRAFT_1404557 [Rhodocollybia butyracea]